MSAVDPKTPNSKNQEPNSKIHFQAELLIGIWFLEFGSWGPAGPLPALHACPRFSSLAAVRSFTHRD